MPRVLLFVCLGAAAIGCQAQNPYAAFGPPTIPSPASNQLPYYPPGTASAATQPTATVSRPSVSVSGPSTVAPRSPITAEASDREPIRIVENVTPTRTASAGRPGVSSPGQPSPNPPHAPMSSGQPLPKTSPGSNQSGQNHVLDSQVAPATYQQRASGGFSEKPATPGQWRAR
jgi:hypothetical protein